MVKNYIKTSVIGKDFLGYLYYIELDSDNIEDKKLAIFEIEYNYHVICNKKYEESMKLISEKTIDLLFVRSALSLGWNWNDLLTTNIIYKIMDEIKNEENH